MLVIESSRRSTARDILGQLARIGQNLNSDDSYIMSKEARGLDLDDDDTRWDPSRYPSPSDKDRSEVRPSPPPLPSPTLEALFRLLAPSAFISLTDRNRPLLMYRFYTERTVH